MFVFRKKATRYRRSDNQSIRDLRVNLITSLTKLHINELKNKTAKYKESELKTPIKVLELNNNMRTSVVHKPEFCTPEVDKPVVREPEVHKHEIHKPEGQKSGVSKSEGQKPGVSKSEISKPEVT